MTGGRSGERGDRVTDRPSREARALEAAAGTNGAAAPVVFGPVLPLTTHAELVVYLAAGFVVGLAAIYFGATQWRVGKILQNTPTERIRSVAAGRTEVEGTCRDVGLTYTEPYGERACVYRHWEVREHRPVDDEVTNEWVTVGSGTDVAPFFVADGTGRILVDTTDAPHFEIADANAVTIEVAEGDPSPPAVASFHDHAAASAGSRERSSVDPRSADPETSGAAGDDAAPLSRERMLEEHVDAMLLDADGELRPEVTAVQLQQELEDVPGVTVEDFFGGTAGRTGDGGSGDADERADQPDPDAVVSELGGTGEAGDLGTGPSVARRLIDRGLGVATGGRLGISGSVTGLERDAGDLDGTHDRRFSQAVLPVGDPVYVYGAAEPRATETGANPDRLKLGEDPATGQFIVSDRDDAGITEQYTHHGPLYVAAGLVVSTLCLAGLLVFVGVA